MARKATMAVRVRWTSLAQCWCRRLAVLGLVLCAGPVLANDPPRAPDSAAPGLHEVERARLDLRRAQSSYSRARYTADLPGTDIWQPYDWRTGGDCEDFAISKRRDLIRAGIDRARLLYAVVRVRETGEWHVVLLWGAGTYWLALDSRDEFKNAVVPIRETMKAYEYFSAGNELVGWWTVETVDA